MENYYISYLELEKRRQNKKDNAYKFFYASISGALIAQFASDIFFSFFFTQENVLKDDIKVSTISSYYAAIATGVLIGISGQYLDRFALIVLTTVVYALVFDYMNALLGLEEFKIDAFNSTFDVLAGIILIYLFDPKAKNDYINHKNERLMLNKEKLDADKTVMDTIIVIVVINAYAGFKQNIFKTDDINTSAADVTIDPGIEL